MGNDLLIATIDGVVYQLPDASPARTAQPILDIKAKVGTGQEQGLVGIVVDPEFPKERYIYVFYTRNDGGCSTEYGVPPTDPAKCYSRLSRFEIERGGRIDPDSERPLLNRIPIGIPNHNAGDLEFGKDGLLYVSIGDGGTDTPGGAEKAQDLSNVHGKILRIEGNGSVPSSNPFAGRGSARCNKGGSTAPGRTCAEIFAYGLRNPFRFAFDPNARGTRFFINDVGERTWEEIDLGRAGANYGWPRREGPCPIGQETGCSNTNPARFAQPVSAYSHSSGCASITGGAFVPNTSDWGAAYRGKYLFGDWSCGKMFTIDGKPQAVGRGAAEEFAVGEPYALTSMPFNPEGTVLYYTQGISIRAIQIKE